MVDAQRSRNERESIWVNDDLDRRLAEIAEMRAQIERMRATAQKCRQRLAELSVRYRAHRIELDGLAGDARDSEAQPREQDRSREARSGGKDRHPWSGQPPHRSN